MSDPLEGIEARLMMRGPSRVVIDGGGTAVTSRQAREEHGVVPDIIFVRGDGWSLAAPSRFERVAYDMWSDEWTHYMRRPSETLRPILEYPT